MPELPPIPSWDGLHPLIVHFPIALLLVAPVLIVAALVLGRRGRGLSVAALILMILGTASTFISVSTGEAAGKLADRSPEINAVIEHHEQLAERTRLVFSLLTVVFAGIVIAPRIIGREASRPAAVIVTALFLVMYAAGSAVLVNTAHNGGRLVHEFGVRALMPSAPIPAVTEED